MKKQSIQFFQSLLTATCLLTSSTLATVAKPQDALFPPTSSSSSSASSTTSSSFRASSRKNDHSKLFYNSQDLHNMAETDQWMSFSDGVEFLPSHRLVNSDWDDAQIREWASRQLQSNTYNSKQSNNKIYRLSPFVPGDTEYDEYQQAWRLLGFMIDCDDELSVFDDDQYQGNQNQDQHSNDGGTGEGCHRYVIWAAYVDLDYQGGGIGEYQYYDKFSKKWNDLPCKLVEDGRCAKMDCHLEGTHWSLLGMFKHKSMDDWMEQLFKHEGMCVWTDDEYDFMADAREAWPDGCEYTGKKSGNGQTIYYGTKPLPGGKITIGLYTDARCVIEYVPEGDDDPITVENVVGNVLAEGGSGDKNNGDDDDDDRYEDSFAGSLARWDDALETFRICQPCVAYDVNNWGYEFDDDNNKGSSYGTYRYGYDDDYRYNYYFGNGQIQGSDFDCYDDADYTNVNQCMKFMAKTEMNTASFRDIMLANAQGTLIENPLAQYMNSKNRGWWQRRRNSTSAFGMYFWFICSLLLFGYGYVSFVRVQRNSNYRLPRFQWSLKQPLVYN